MTTYQNRVVQDIHRELKARFAALKATYGEGFVDVVTVSYHKHGQNLTGYTTMFNGRQSFNSTSFASLVEFVRKVFGSGGRLKLIDNDEKGCRYAVIR